MILRLMLALAALALPAGAQTPYRSEVAGIDLVALDALPASPAPGPAPEFCTHLLVAAPETPAGRAVAAGGWLVTAEVALDELVAVSFIASAEPATSGACGLIDGNIGLFSGEGLVALAYGTEAGGLTIGWVRPFGGGGLRVYSGEILSMPVADLRRNAHGDIALVALATEEPVCGGAASVPLIYNLPIDEARKRLLAAGWAPVPGDPAEQAHGFAADIAAAGVPEVETCSGTGFAFCRYAYSSPAGELGVSTAFGGENGSLPEVVGYAADCR